MKRYATLFSIMLTLPTATYAEDKAVDDCSKPTEVEKLAKTMLAVSDKAMECPNPGEMKDLCIYIDNYKKDPDGTKYVYYYERVVYEASCVDIETDSDEDISRKVREMWDKHGKHLNCDRLGTSVLKFGAEKTFDLFLQSAAHLWKIDFNYYDQTDGGKTLLDYIDDRLAGPIGPETKRKFLYYRKIITEGGGKKDRN